MAPPITVPTTFNAEPPWPAGKTLLALGFGLFNSYLPSLKEPVLLTTPVFLSYD